MRLRRWPSLILLLVLAGCRADEEPLRIGSNLWPGYAPLRLAEERGYFGNTPVRHVEFSSATEVVRAYRNGLIDVAALSADEAIIAAEGQPGHRIVLVCDLSHGADVVMARPGVDSMAALKGKRVAAETTVLGAYVLSRALELSGLKPTDVEVVPTVVPDHEAAYRSGKVDAVVTFEPHRTRLLAAGARVVFDSSQIPGEIADVLLTRPTLPPAHERALRVVVGGWFRALDDLRREPDATGARAAAVLGIEPRAFRESLLLMEQPDRDAVLRLMRGPDSPLAVTLRGLSARMLEHRFIADAITPPVVDDRIIKSTGR